MNLADLLAAAPRPQRCYVCEADAITVGVFVPHEAMRLLLGVDPDAVMVFGLCVKCYRPGFSELIERRLLADVPVKGNA